MSAPFAPISPRPAICRWLPVLALLMLAACGGGGSSDMVSTAPFSTAPVSTAPASTGMAMDAPEALKAKPARSPGLVQQAAMVVEAIHVESGRESAVAVGALADGGDIAVWLTLNPTDALAPARLSMQRQDASGAAVGTSLRLPGLFDPSNVAVLVRPNGELVVIYAVLTRSTTELGVQTTSIFLQRFASDATRIGGEIEVISSTQNVFAVHIPVIFRSPAIAQWQDGSWVVAWERVQRSPNGPTVQVQTQRFSSSGQAVGTVNIEATSNQEGFSLATVEPHDLLISVQRRAQDNSLNVFFASGLAALPDSADATGLPLGSFAVPLSRGEAVLFSGRSQGLNGPLVDAFSQRINRGGHAAGQPNVISTLPDTAVALPDGGYVVVRPVADGVQRIAELYDRHGALLGNPTFLGFRTPGVKATVLADGAVLLAWTDNVTGFSRLVTQRLLVGA
jgi:hypothetical protein